MASYFYQFLVHHYCESGAGGFSGHFFETQHDYEFDRPLTWRDMKQYASTLVMAERLIMDSAVAFELVSCFLLNPDKPFGLDTVCYTMVMPDRNLSVDGSGIRGMRPFYGLGGHAGITTYYNRATGKPRVRFVPFSADYTDMGIGPRRAGQSRKYPLKMNGSVAQNLWPQYQALLEGLYGLYSSWDFDRFGVGVEGERVVDWARIGSLRINNHYRQSLLWASPPKTWANRMIGEALLACAESLRLQQASMNEFDHTWGNGHAPDFFSVIFSNNAANVLWFHLAKAIGYQIPEQYQNILPAPNPREYPRYSPERGELKIADKNGLVLDIVGDLFRVYQAWQEYFDNFLAHAASFTESIEGNPERLTYMVWRVKWLFDNYDYAASLAYYQMKLLTLLQRILIVTNPRGAGGHSVRQRDTPRNKYWVASYTTPANLELVIFEPVFPPDKFPFLTLSGPNEVSVRLPDPAPPPVPVPPYVPPVAPDEDEPDPDTTTRRGAGRNHIIDDYYNDDQEKADRFLKAAKYADDLHHYIKNHDYAGILK